MENILVKTSHFLGAINEFVGKTVACLTTALVLLFCYDVFMRYLFNSTSVWITELEWHLYALVFILGAGYALKHDKHVRVDLFYSKFSPKGKALVDLFGSLIFLIPWCIIIIIAATKYAHNSWLILEGSPNPGGLPFRFIIKFSMALGMLLLLLQGIAMVLDALCVLIYGEKKI